MARWMSLCLAAYAPHLVEEHLTGMWDDAVIATAFRPFAELPSRQAAYLLFQITLGLALLMTWAAMAGGRWQRAVLAGLGAAMLCESHHVVRALATHHYNSGLVTSLPMPVVGAIVLVAALTGRSLGAPRRDALPARTL